MHCTGFVMHRNRFLITAIVVLSALICSFLQITPTQSKRQDLETSITHALNAALYPAKRPTINEASDVPRHLEPRQWAGQPRGCRLNEASPCMNMTDPAIKRCPDGELFAGWLSGCNPLDLNFGDALCCPVTRSPTSCIWRGQESDGHTCNGQCHEGEVALLQSPYGGGYNSTMPLKRCDAGSKIFCCQAGHWSQLQQQCYYGDCEQGCSAGDISVASLPDPRCGKKNEVLEIIDRDYCCKAPTKFKNCHWVGTGNCFDNNFCPAYEFELLRDRYGGDGKECTSRHRQKALCCQMDAHEPAFEAVPATWLFPEEKGRASPTDYVNFEISNLQAEGVSVDPRHLPFGWIVIEGPAEAVANLDVKRDGSASDLVFLDCNADKSGSARFVCTSEQYGTDSDCDHMMTGGLAGTIIELPRICQAGKHAVARQVLISDDQSLPVDLGTIANQTVFELSFDFAFDLAKRDAGDIYFRMDYDNAGGYWEDVVNSSTLNARSLESRFVSNTDGDWQSKLEEWLLQPQVGSKLECKFNQTLISSELPCEAGQSTFIHIRAQGSITSTVKIASTVYGRLAPSPDIDHAHLLMLANIDADIRLDVSMSGNISSFEQQGTFGASLFLAKQEDVFKASGLAFVAPTLKADIGIQVNADMEGNFTTNLRFRTTDPIVRAWPEKYHPSKGTVTQLDADTAFEGWIGEITGDSELQIDFQPMVGARAILDPKTFRDRKRDFSMVFDDQFWTPISAQTRILADATTDSGQHTWNVSTLVGSILAQIQDPNGFERHVSAFGNGDAVFFNSKADGRLSAHGKSGDTFGQKPPIESVSDGVETAFKGLSLSCTRNDRRCRDGDYTCKIDPCQSFSDDCPFEDDSLGSVEDSIESDEDNGEVQIGQDSQLVPGNSSFTLAAPFWNIKDGGKPRPFVIQDPNQPGQPLVIYSMGYPYSSILFKGRNGADVLPEAFEYEAINDCGNVEVRKLSVPLHLKDSSGSLKAWPETIDFATEHIIELQTVAQFIRAMTPGILPSGKPVRAVLLGAPNSSPTVLTGVPMSWFKTHWNQPALQYQALPPVGSAIGRAVWSPNNRVFHALGSNLNRKHLVLTHKEINAVKGMLWDRDDPRMEEKFNNALKDWIDRKKCGDPALFLKWIKVTCVVYKYVTDTPEVAERFRSTNEDMRNQLSIISRYVPGALGLPELWDVFFGDLLETIERHAVQWMIARLTSVVDALKAAPKKPDNWKKVVADMTRLALVLPDWSMPTIDDDDD